MFNGLKRLANAAWRLIFLIDIVPCIKKVDKIFYLPLASLLNLGKSLSDVFGSYLLSEIVQTWEENKNANILGYNVTLSELVITLGFLYLYSRSSPYLVRIAIVPIRQHFGIKLGQLLFEKTYSVPYEQSLKNKVSFEEAVEYLADVHDIPLRSIGMIHQPLLTSIISSLVIFSRYGAIIGSIFTAYSFLQAIISLLVYNGLGVHETVKKARKIVSKLKKNYKDALANIDIVKINNHAQLEKNISQTRNKEYFLLRGKGMKREGFALLFASLIPPFADFAIIIYMILSHQLQSNISELIFILTLLSTIYTNNSRLIESFYYGLEVLVKLDVIKKVLGFKDEELLITTVTPTFIGLPSTIKIEFIDVWFKYNETSDWVLKGISFSILTNQSLAIVGKSGSGKSTITKLLMRLYKISSGTIKMNGMDIYSIPINEFYKTIAFLPQNTNLFDNDTLAYNILYGGDNENLLLALKLKNDNKKTVTQNALRAISETTPLLVTSTNGENPELLTEKEYNDLDDSLQIAALENLSKETQASELSGGQRQRVALARAIMREPDIIVIDEGTASLDAQTEHQVINSVTNFIKNNQKASLAIAHRLNSIKNSDYIIVLEEGEIKETGNHNELMNYNSAYKNLWELSHS